jgi:hypothetical protein
MPSTPNPGAPMVALGIPVYLDAGDVHGVAVAFSFDGNSRKMHYLVLDQAAHQPPVWVSEDEVESARVAEPS